MVEIVFTTLVALIIAVIILLILVSFLLWVLGINKFFFDSLVVNVCQVENFAFGAAILCGPPIPPIIFHSCGNGFCEQGPETADNCCEDCGTCPIIPPPNSYPHLYDCSNSKDVSVPNPVCGDGICQCKILRDAHVPPPSCTIGDTCSILAAGLGGENPYNCPQDCKLRACGNGICEFNASEVGAYNEYIDVDAAKVCPASDPASIKCTPPSSTAGPQISCPRDCCVSGVPGPGGGIFAGAALGYVGTCGTNVNPLYQDPP